MSVLIISNTKCNRLILFVCNVLFWLVFLLFSGNNQENTEQAQQVISTSKSIQNSNSERRSSESTIKQEDFYPNLRIPNDLRTPLVEQNKSNRTAFFPPPPKKPLVASTPAAMVPAQKSSTSTSTVTTPLEKRTCGTTPQQENYSILPEGNLYPSFVSL